MYRLLTGLVQHLTRKEEYNVIILGLDNAGKTTFLEKVKTIYTPSTPGLAPSLITPTIGQNIGRITLSSHHLLFWDLGGQTDLRPIWDKYFRDADAVCWIIDSRDRERCGWEGIVDGPEAKKKRDEKGGGKGKERAMNGGEEDDEEEGARGEGWKELERVLRSPHIRGIPVLVLANKQEPVTPDLSISPPSDSPSPPQPAVADATTPAASEPRKASSGPPMRVEEIKEMFNRLVMESDRPYGFSDEKKAAKKEALGVSEAMVMGVSALNGDGIREAVNWLFYRVAMKAHSRRTQAMMAQESPSTSPSMA